MDLLQFFQFVMSGSHEVAEQYQFYVCKKEKIPRKSLVCISVFLMAFAVCFVSVDDTCICMSFIF